MKRRTYLATAVAGAGLLAGCMGSGESDEEPENGDTDDENDDSIEDQPTQTVEAGTFDDFEDLGAWTVMDGSLLADEDRSVVGSQSARLRANYSQRSVMIKREFDAPHDFSDQLPALAVASELTDPVIQLTDLDGDRLLMRAEVESDGPLVAQNFGVYDRVGDPNLSEIAHVKISTWAGENNQVKMWCDDLRFVSRPETGTVVLQFEGGHETAATEARPILEEYDYPATAFVHTDQVGADGKLDVDQLSELADAGWTVGSHGAGDDSLGRLGESEQEADISAAVDWFGEHGFDDDVPFAYPNDDYDETTLDLVADHHDLAFTAGYPVHGYLNNPHLCPQLVSPDAEEATEILDRTAEYRGITTISYRELDLFSRADFEETIEHLHDLESDGDLEVVLPGTLADEYLH